MSTRWLTALCLLVGAAPAAAQVTLADKIPNNFTLNAADCDADADTYTFRYEFTVEGLEMISYALHLYENFGDCPTLLQVVPDYEIQDFGGFSSLTSSNRFLPVDNDDQEVNARFLLGDDICDGGVRSNYVVCLYMADVQPQVDAGIAVQPIDVFLTEGTDLTVDTSVPGTPNQGVPTAGDESITLNIDNEADITDDGETISYVIQYRACSASTTTGDAGTTTSDAGSVASSCSSPNALTTVTQDSLTVTGLVNDTEYELRVALQDDFDNQGPYSGFVSATPDSGFTPGALYNGDPNPLSLHPTQDSCDPGEALDEGDACAQTDGPPSVPVIKLFGAAMLAFMLLRRRRRRKNANPAAVLVALALGVAAPASAYVGQITANVKVGPYVPAIDTEMVGGNRIYPIYRCFFQTESSFPPGGVMPLPEIDVDFHAFDLIGSLEFGVGVSGMQVRGKAFEKTTANEEAVAAGECGTAGSSSVELSMLFIKPRLTYRFDVLHDYLGIPLVPYGRAALIGGAYMFSRDGAWDQSPLDPPPSDANTGAHRNPLGARLGYEGALGLMVGVNWLDLVHMWTLSRKLPEILRGGDWPKQTPKTAVNNIYFFVEGVYSEIDTFRQPGLRLGPIDPVFGTELPMTVNLGFAVELQ